MKHVVLLVITSLFVYAQLVKFKKSEVKIGQKKITVEIAKSDAEMEQGLMYRKSLKPDEGMLFVYKDEGIRSFWMKNTLIPLSIGFFNKNRELIDVQEMVPVSEMALNIPQYESSGPAMFALEMPKGWFKRNNFSDKRTKLEFLDRSNLNK